MSRLYEFAMRLQSELDRLKPGSPEQDLAKQVGMDFINQSWTPSKRVLRASRAFHFRDGLTRFQDHNVEFDETILIASIPNLVVAQLAIRQIIALPCYESTIVGPENEISADMLDAELDFSGHDTVLLAGEKIRRPLYVPVEDVKFIALAA